MLIMIFKDIWTCAVRPDPPASNRFLNTIYLFDFFEDFEQNAGETVRGG